MTTELDLAELRRRLAGAQITDVAPLAGGASSLTFDGMRDGRKVVIKVAPPSVPFHDCFDYRRRYPDGRIGSDPSLSTPEHGKRIYNAAVEDMVEAYQAFMA